MPARLRLMLAALFAAWVPVLGAQGRCLPGATALVLSGGGAKGLAHVGVVRALERAGVRPDLIVGSSMGAVIGALVASGYNAAQIDSIARQLPLAAVFRTALTRGPVAWGSRLPVLLWTEGERGFSLHATAVEQRAIGGMLSEALLRGNLLARGDFDRLPIPLRVVTTNMADRGITVFAHGDLAQVVRASIAIPLVFTPQRIGDSVYADGGLSANIPIQVARDAGAARVIVSDVTESPLRALNLESPLVVADRLLNWLFRQPADSLESGDLRIRPAIGGFEALDFSPEAIDSLITLGDSAASRALSNWECEPDTESVPAASAALPSIVIVAPGGVADRRAFDVVRQALRLENEMPLAIAALGRDVRDLATREVFKDVWLGPEGSGDTVVLNPILTQLPRRAVGVGLLYDGELGGRAWIAGLDRRAPLLGSEASAVLTLSRFASDLQIELRRGTRLGQARFTPLATLTLTDNDVRRFTASGLELPVTQVLALETDLGFERQLGSGFWLNLTGGLRSWQEQDPVSAVERTRTTIGGAATLRQLAADRREVLTVEVVLTPAYSRVTADLHVGGRVGSVQVESRVLAGIGHDLPADLVFSLGGREGFPGLHLGERPGDSQLLTSLTLSRHLIGPIRLRLGVAVGRTGFGQTEFLTAEGELEAGQILPGFYFPGGLLAGNGWLSGIRFGVGTDTPVGPIRLEYGFNDQQRGAVYFRVGSW